MSAPPIVGPLSVQNMLAELAANPAPARANLGLGGAAILNVGTITGTLFPGDLGASAINGVVTAAMVNSAGHLILTRQDGTSFDTGYVIGPASSVPGPMGLQGMSAAQGALTSGAANEARQLYRDVVPGYLFAFRDGLGRIGGAIDSKGGYTGKRINLISGLYRDFATYPITISDPSGRSSLKILPSGNLSLSVNDMRILSVPQPYRDVPIMGAFRIIDPSGRYGFGIQPSGQVDLKPSAYTIQKFQQGLYGYPAPAMGTAQDFFNVRGGALAGTRLASVQDPFGRVYDVIQNNNSPLKTALKAASSPLALMSVHLQYGQSNAGGGGTIAATGPWALTAINPNLNATNNNGGQKYATPAWNGYTTYDYAAYVDPGGATAGPLYSLTGTLYALAQFERDAGVPSTLRYGRSIWWGSQPIDTFMPVNNLAYQVLIAECQGIAQIAASYDRTPVCHVMTFVEGENTSATVWQTGFMEIVAQFAIDIAAIFPNQNSGVTPAWFIAQVNNADNDQATGANVNALSQLTTAQQGGQYVTMFGPLYMGPVEVNSVHNIEAGRVMVGEIQAEAEWQWTLAKKATGTGAWNPLWPTALTVHGTNQLVVTYALPPGGGSLEIDTDWVGSPTPVLPGAALGALANYGFTYSDGGGNVILSVAITASNQITLTFSGNIATASNRIVSYAMGNAPIAVGSASGWSNTRGQIRSPTTQVSPGYRAGYPIPQFIKHYSVRFQQAF